MKPSDDEHQGPVIRDRRRIDPQTGQVRDVPGQGQPGQAGRGGIPPRPGRAARPAAARVRAALARAAPARAVLAQAGPAAPGAPGAPAAPVGPASPQAPLAGAAVTWRWPRPWPRSPSAPPICSGCQAEYANYRKRVERDRMAVREQALANVLSELLPVLDDIGRAREHGELTGGFKSVAESLESAVTKLGLTAFGENGDPFDPTLHDALMHSYSAEVTEPTCVQILQPGYKVGDRIVRPARVAVAEPSDGSGSTEDGEPSDGPGAGRSGQFRLRRPLTRTA